MTCHCEAKGPAPHTFPDGAEREAALRSRAFTLGFVQTAFWRQGQIPLPGEALALFAEESPNAHFSTAALELKAEGWGRCVYKADCVLEGITVSSLWLLHDDA